MGALKTDAFTGADGTALNTYNANWASPIGNVPVLKSNAVACASSAHHFGRWDGLTWPADQYSQAVVVALSDVQWCVFVRQDTGANFTHYAAGQDPNDYGNNHYNLWKRVASAFTSLGTSTQDALPGDIVKLQISGTTLNLYVNTLLVIGPITDTSIATGSAGFDLFHTVANVALLDTFEGGDLVSGTTPLVGAGTLTGIAGRMDLGITGRSMIRG